MRDARPWLLGLAALALVGASEVRRFERAAAREIASKLNGEPRVSVRTRARGLFGHLEGDLASVLIEAESFSTDELPLFTEPERSQRGRVGRLELRLRDFYLAGLRVERLQASIPGCRFDLGLAQRRRQIRLSRSGVGTGTVTLRQQDLEAFILRKYPEIKRVSVTLAGDRATVVGHGEFLILKSDFRVVARLIPMDGRQIALADASVELDGRSADPAASKVLLESLNPVVDLDRDLRLHGALRLERIELRDGLLVASGSTRIPERPRG